MFQRNYAASTANTYVSALGYSHRLAGVHDPTKVFWVIEMLKGYGKLGSRLDTRLPITLPILRSILQQTPTIYIYIYMGVTIAGIHSPQCVQCGEKIYNFFCNTERFRNSPVVHAINE